MAVVGRSSSRFICALAATAIALAFSVGCDRPEVEVTRPSIEYETVSSVTPSANPTEEPEAYTDVLRYPVHDCGSADPAVEASYFGFPMANEIHAGLTRLTAHPESGFELELAASYEVDDSGVRYTFRLRPGLEFSDGNALTAYDFVWSWNRAARKARLGGSAHTVFGSVSGFAEAAGSGIAEMAGVRAEDELTLVVDLVRPATHFPMMLAHPVAAVLDPDNADYWDDVWASSGFVWETTFDAYTMPTGAGPFRLVEYRFGSDRCVLERNPRYWDQSVDVVDRVELVIPDREDLNRAESQAIEIDTVDGDGFLRIAMKTDFEDSTRAAYEAGEIDVMVPLSPTVADLEGVVVPVQPARAEFLMLSPLVPPMNDPDFRMALLHASPEFKFEGNAVSRLLPQSIVAETSLRGRVEFDADLAADFLDRCECSEEAGAALQYHQLYVGPGLIPAQVVFQSWKDVLGLEVSELFDLPDDALRDFASGELGLYSMAVETQYPHPSAVLDQVLSAIPGLEKSRPYFKTLSDRAASAADAEESARLYLELEQELLDSGFVIPLNTIGTSYAMVKPWVRGLGPAWPGASFFRDVRIVGRP